MGLDIYHFKASMLQPENTRPDEWAINRDTYEGFKVPISYFNEFIQTILLGTLVSDVIIVEDPLKLGGTKAWFHEAGYPVFLKKNADQLDAEIAAWEHQNKWRNYFKHPWKAKDWKGISYYEMKKTKGFYIQELGYQRKGMNADFRKRFFSGDGKYNFVDLEDFQFAYKCIDHYWEKDTDEEVEQRRKIFKADFLDQYEPGASFMMVSG